jgi:hypothetical protein
MNANVFISSTSYDLADYRQATIEVCNRLKMNPIAMEFFEAMGVGATAGSKRKLDESTLYIGIFAHRYGYIEAGYTQSVTEIEFDYAGELGLDRLCFLVDPAYPWSPEAIEFAQMDKLTAFKKRINTSLIRAYFTDVNDFKAKLMQALIAWRDATTHAHTSVQVFDTTIPPMTTPPLPTLLIGREDDLHTIKHRMGIHSHPAPLSTTVIHGWPGVGKTTFVTALAYDEHVISAFPDGILWASVGDNPNPYHELKTWGKALGADMTHIKTLDDAISYLRAVLRDKKALLIVDDVWERDDAIPFKVGGANCFTIITTRFLDVARQLITIPDELFRLGTLSDEQGFALLQRLAPTVTNQYPSPAKSLVSDLEGLPLALRVAGRLLEADIQDGFDPLLLMNSIRDNHDLLKAVAPDDRYDPHTGTTPTVQLLLKKSTDRLDDHTRQCFAFLGAFAPKPATFDMDAMKAVWLVDDPQPIVRKLVDRGLLEPIVALGRYWMHAVLVMHANSLLEDD